MPTDWTNRKKYEKPHVFPSCFIFYFILCDKDSVCIQSRQFDTSGFPSHFLRGRELLANNLKVSQYTIYSYQHLHWKGTISEKEIDKLLPTSPKKMRMRKTPPALLLQVSVLIFTIAFHQPQPFILHVLANIYLFIYLFS